MNGTQIQHMLNLIEESTALNRPIIRREVAEYLSHNMDSVIEQMEKSGEAKIPTAYGSVKLTREDLTLAAA